jgi:quercetin dioxygenase-like cupin family protein
MPSTQVNSNVHRQIAQGTSSVTLDVFGSTVEFLISPEDTHDDLSVMRGMIPPGVAVPLHSHDDTEDFLILAGTQQVLTQGPQSLEWTDAHAGDYIHVPGGTLHAHRNVSREPVIDLIITTARLGQFFQEAGRPAAGSSRPPGPDEVARFLAICAEYGYSLGTPEENAAVGIEMPQFASDM